MIKGIFKFLILLVIFLVVGIFSKIDLNFRDKVYYYLYEDCFDFSMFRNFYNEYLGDFFPFSFDSSVAVFSEDIKYFSISKYFDGYSLNVGEGYLVPAIEDGIVTYVGYKEDYGNVVIVMGNDGVSIWYGNLNNFNYKLYDNVLKGSFIGEVSSDSLYLVFCDENGYLDYDRYLN